MNKLFGSGAQVTYGPDLPTADQTFDGALHYRTGTGEGLYLYSIIQDVNTFQVGDQISKRWTPITLKDNSNTILGGTLNGSLQIISQDYFNGLTFSNDTYSSSGYIGPRAGSNTGMQFGSNAGPVVFSAGVQNGGVGSAVLMFSKDGALQYWPNFSNQGGGGNVWHAGNDGATSGLDADLLDGQDGSYYLNAGNLNTGVLNIARLPFQPVQQGGGTGMATNKVYIGWTAGGNLALQIDTTSFGSTWPIGITGNAAQATTAGYANSAGSANTANTATNAGYATNAGAANTANYATSAGSAASVNALNNQWGVAQYWGTLNQFATDHVAVAAGGGSGFNLRASRGAGGGGAGMSFLIPNQAGINIGLDSDNVFRIGGWSFSTPSGTGLMNLDGAGNVIFNGNVTAYSDKKLKKDITPIENALFKVKQLTGVNFTRVSDDVRGTGLLAQDVQAVLPEAVMESKGGLSLAYGNLAGLFVEAMKEMSAKIAGLEKELAALKKAV